MSRVLLIVLTGCWAVGFAPAQNKVSITFTSQAKNPTFDAAVDEHQRLWAAEGARIIEAMERTTTLKFPDKRIKAEIYEGPSFSGRGNAPMRFRSSYAADEKKGTLVHELGHRMNEQLKKRPQDLDEHRLLFLYLYDLYVDLYGKEFADRQVTFGKTLKGLYDYEGAWNWALSMRREDRLSRFADVLKANRK